MLYRLKKRLALLVLILLVFLFTILGVRIVSLGIMSSLWGVLGASIFLLGALIIGDKILLFMIKARSVSQENKIISLIDNCVCCFNLKPIEVYQSDNISQDILFLDSFFFKSSLVISSDYLLNLKEDTIGDLISQGMLKVKKENQRVKIIGIICCLFLYIPIFICERIFGFSKLKLFLRFTLFPIYILENIIFNLPAKPPLDLGSINTNEDTTSYVFLIQNLSISLI